MCTGWRKKQKSGPPEPDNPADRPLRGGGEGKMSDLQVFATLLVGFAVGVPAGTRWARVWHPALRRRIAETRKAILQSLIRALEEERKDKELSPVTAAQTTPKAAETNSVSVTHGQD